MKGVDAIEHTASPFHFKADDPAGESPIAISFPSLIRVPRIPELLEPAIKGTVGILESVLKYGSVLFTPSLLLRSYYVG